MNTPYFLPGGKLGCCMIHGFSGSPGEVADLGRYLHQQGYTVKGVLLKGHGTSPEDLRRTDWRDWYASVTAAVEELRAAGCREVWAVGLSLGGALSLYAASQGLVNGVIAMAAPIGLLDNRAKFAGFLKHVVAYWPVHITKEQQERNHRAGRSVYTRLPLKAVQSLYRFIGMVKQALPLVKVPALIVHAQQDRVILPESGNYIYQTIASRQKEFLLLTKSGHIVTEDQEKELLFQAVLAFLRKHGALHEI